MKVKVTDACMWSWLKVVKPVLEPMEKTELPQPGRDRLLWYSWSNEMSFGAQNCHLKSCWGVHVGATPTISKRGRFGAQVWVPISGPWLKETYRIGGKVSMADFLWSCFPFFFLLHTFFSDVDETRVISCVSDYREKSIRQFLQLRGEFWLVKIVGFQTHKRANSRRRCWASYSFSKPWQTLVHSTLQMLKKCWSTSQPN